MTVLLATDRVLQVPWPEGSVIIDYVASDGATFALSPTGLSMRSGKPSIQSGWEIPAKEFRAYLNDPSADPNSRMKIFVGRLGIKIPKNWGPGEIEYFIPMNKFMTALDAVLPP